MEISKENVFKVGYTSVLNGNLSKQKKRTNHIIKFIRENKLVSITMIIFVVCVSFNFILIYNFMKILENCL